MFIAMEGSRWCCANRGQSDEVINARKAWNVEDAFESPFIRPTGRRPLGGVFSKVLSQTTVPLDD